MNRKLLCLLGLTAFISSPVYALEVVGGTVIAHKEWTHGKGKATFQSVSTNKKSFAHVNSKSHLVSAPSDFIVSSAHAAYDATATLNNYTYLEGNHRAYITNNSDTDQIYWVSRVICLTSSSDTEVCSENDDEVNLAPNGYIDDMTISRMSAYITDPNVTYTQYNSTEISNVHSSYVFVSEDSRPVQVVTNSNTNAAKK